MNWRGWFIPQSQDLLTARREMAVRVILPIALLIRGGSLLAGDYRSFPLVFYTSLCFFVVLSLLSIAALHKGRISLSAVLLLLLFVRGDLATMAVDGYWDSSLVFLAILNIVLAGTLLSSAHLDRYAVSILGLYVFAMIIDRYTHHTPIPPNEAWPDYAGTLAVYGLLAWVMIRYLKRQLEHTIDAQEALIASLENEISESKQVEAALRESEERFRVISSVTSDYTYSSRVNVQGELEHMLLTGAFEEITGYTPEEFMAVGGWRATLHPDDLEQDARDMATLQKNQRVITEVRVVQKGGAVRWVRIYAHPVWDPVENRLVGINGGVRDITERKQAEEALNESEKRYRVISEMISDYAYAYKIHADGSFTPYWITEDSFRRMTGFAWEEIGAKFVLYHSEDADLAREHVAQTLKGHPISGEYRIVTKDGETRWLRIHRQVEWDDKDHHPIRVYGAAQDITEHKRFEAELRSYTNQLEKLVDERTTALRRAKEQLELVLNHTANALAFANPSGDILVTNPAYRAVFAERGVQSIEFILWSLATEEQVVMVGNALLRAIYDNEVQRVEAQIISVSNEEIDIDLTLIPVSLTDDDARNGVLLSGHDITQIKEIERFKTRFVADAVHDLATPIAGLSTRLYMLQHNPERLEYHVRAFENQVRHLRNLLDDLRTLSRMDRGQMALNLKVCDVGALVQRVFDTYEPVAINKHQMLLLTIDPALPEITLDQQQIERVLVNLVANAVNYTLEDKEICLEAAVEDRTVVISVVDQGMGIGAEDLPHVFERFYRTAEARESLSSGTGLGLAIAKEIVELHGGSITVSSQYQQGSTFSVRLPIRR